MSDISDISIVKSDILFMGKTLKMPIISKNEMLAIQNAVTGEIEMAKVSIHISREMPKFRDKFTVLFQAVNCAMVKDIKPITAKLLLYFCSVVQYGNLIDRNMDEICEDLGYKRAQVSIAVKDLLNMKIIIKVPNGNDKRRNLFMLNPHQSWKGKAVDRAKKIAEYNPQQLLLDFNK